MADDPTTAGQKAQSAIASGLTARPVTVAALLALMGSATLGVYTYIGGMGTWPGGVFRAADTALIGGKTPADVATSGSATDLAMATYVGLGSLTVSPVANAFNLGGYGIVGDLGSGMPMVRGNSTGPLAKQSADGSWWVLDITHLRNVPIGYCGGKTDDSTDNTAAANQCAAVGAAANKRLSITGVGVFRLGASGTVSTPFGVDGDGRWLSFVRNMAVDHPMFTGTSATTQRYTGLHVLPGTAPYTAGAAAIFIDAASGQNSYKPDVSDSIFQSQYVDINCNRCNSPSIHGIGSTNYTFASIILDNVDQPDNGDQHLFDLTLDAGGNNSAIGILQNAAGGLTVTDSKIGNGANCYKMNLRNGVNTSILNIYGISCEGTRASPILLTRQAGSNATFNHVMIHQNELAGPAGFPQVDVQGGTWLNDVASKNNTMLGDAIGTNFAGGLNVEEGGNTILGFGGGTAVAVAPGVTGHLGTDILQGVPTVCQCLSGSMSYDLKLVKISPTPASASAIAGAVNPTGYNTVPSFKVTFAPSGSFYGDIVTTGTVAGFSQAVAHLAFSQYGTNGIVTETQQYNPSQASSSAASGFGYTSSVAGGVLSINTAYNAGSAGTTFTSIMRIVGGTGTFATQ